MVLYIYMIFIPSGLASKQVQFEYTVKVPPEGLTRDTPTSAALHAPTHTLYIAGSKVLPSLQVEHVFIYTYIFLHATHVFSYATYTIVCTHVFIYATHVLIYATYVVVYTIHQVMVAAYPVYFPFSRGIPDPTSTALHAPTHTLYMAGSKVPYSVWTVFLRGVR